MSKRLVFLLCAALACAVLVAACGDDGGGGDSTGSEETGATEGVKAVDPASMEGATGSVTYCSGKDTSGDLKETIAEFNEANPDLQVKLVEFPEDAQQQHDQFVQRQKAKSGDCDAFEEDVVWTAEFASQKWLMDMSDYIETRKDDFIPSTLETVTFDGKVFGAPRASDAGMMYYRTDQVKEFPATWQELYAEAAKGDGLVYQGSAYEGLTVDYLEYAFAAGGTVISEDGTKSTINSPENVKALQFMVDGIKDGAAPKAVTTMTEEPARRTWEAGKATFMRNWSYCYALSQEAPEVKGKFAVAPYPEYEGGGKAAVLGGHNMVISVYSKNPGGALKFIDYATSPSGSPRTRRSTPRRRRSGPHSTTRRSRRRCRSPTRCERASRTPSRVRCLRSIRRSPRRSSRTSTRRCRARPLPRTRSSRPTRTSTTRWPPSRS